MEMKMKISHFVIMALFFLIAFSCNENPANSNSNNNAPADHSISKSGVKHKSGLTNPTANCVECHGTDLKGGTASVSCFSCHGKKW
jgi:hypothetical protein